MLSRSRLSGGAPCAGLVHAPFPLRLALSLLKRTGSKRDESPTRPQIGLLCVGTPVACCAISHHENLCSATRDDSLRTARQWIDPSIHIHLHLKYAPKEADRYRGGLRSSVTFCRDACALLHGTTNRARSWSHRSICTSPPLMTGPRPVHTSQSTETSAGRKGGFGHLAAHRLLVHEELAGVEQLSRDLRHGRSVLYCEVA